MREIKITNTMSGKKETLETLQPGKLTFYSCGPTVYGLIHIGNLRSALVSDMMNRYFRRAGYQVTYVRNYTDVDDKIIAKGKEEGISAAEVAVKYTKEVEKDFAVAGVQEPDHKTTVTDHMPEIIAMIQKIIENERAYVAEGDVFFSIQNFPGYGKLSGKNVEELLAGARVEVDLRKKNPLDFALWKSAKPGEPAWDSPWGKGRPGWHIECSAMASKWLGRRIDVHHGGEDLIFPHHENEIAQSEAASGEEPFVRYWVHHAFLTLSKAKMSKSLGNIFTAREFLTQYSGEFARYMLLSVHYRHPIDFGEETIENTITGLTRLYEAKAQAADLTRTARARADLRAEGAWGQFVASCEQARKQIDECLANDFNASGALGALFTLIREFNRTVSEPLAAATPSAALGAAELIRVIEEDIGGVLGFGRLEARKALEDLGRIRAMRHAPEAGAPTEAEIQQAIVDRAEARKRKDFGEADRIRKDLEARGVILKDGPGGTTWTHR
jgi:cysteinyl-tRNA synthetase